MRLIDADELKKKFLFEDELKKKIWFNRATTMFTLSIILDVINSMPTITKYGHWILCTNGSDKDFSVMYKCSVCKKISPKPSERCPYCKAEMDKGVVYE